MLAQMYSRHEHSQFTVNHNIEATGTWINTRDVNESTLQSECLCCHVKTHQVSSMQRHDRACMYVYHKDSRIQWWRLILVDVLTQGRVSDWCCFLRRLLLSGFLQTFLHMVERTVDVPIPNFLKNDPILHPNNRHIPAVPGRPNPPNARE
jgi:hypothetical protein